MTPVAHGRQMLDTGADQSVRRLHVHHLGRAGITDATDVADEHDAVLVNLERRVVHPFMVIFRALKDDGAGLVHILGALARQKSFAEIIRDHACFHQRRVEQVAGKHQKARVRAQRSVIGQDNLGIAAAPVTHGFRHRLARCRHGIAMQAPGREQLSHDRGNATGAVKTFAQIFARGLDIGQKRHVKADFLPIGDMQLYACVARDRLQMRRRVGRAANRRVDHDRILEGLAGQNIRGLQIFLDHRDDAAAGFIGHSHPLAERGGNRGIAGQAHPEGLGHGVHGAGGAHRVAMAQRRRRGADAAHEFFKVDLAIGQKAAAFPDDGTRAGALSVPPAIQHRAAVQRDRRQVNRGRPHQHGRRGLVAARGQDNAVNRVAVQHLDQRQIGEVSVKCRGRALAGLLDRMHRKFHRHAAGIADTRLDAVHQEDMDLVAGRKVAAGLRNADHRAVPLQLSTGVFLVQVAFQIQRRHPRVVRIVEPFLRAVLLASAGIGHVFAFGDQNSIEHKQHTAFWYTKTQPGTDAGRTQFLPSITPNHKRPETGPHAMLKNPCPPTAVWSDAACAIAAPISSSLSRIRRCSTLSPVMPN